MASIKQTHMDRELRAFTDEQVNIAELNILRANGHRNLAEEVRHQIEVGDQENTAYRAAEQFRRERSLPSPLSSTDLTVTNPHPLEQSLNNLGQIVTAYDTAINWAAYHADTAKLAVEGKLTPTEKVNDYHRKLSEIDNSIADHRPSLQGYK